MKARNCLPLALFLFTAVCGQIDNHDVNHLIRKLQLFGDQKNLQYVASYLDELLQRHPWLSDPLGAAVRARPQGADVGLLGSSVASLLDSVCKMATQWQAAPQLNDQCAASIKLVACTFPKLVGAITQDCSAANSSRTECVACERRRAAFVARNLWVVSVLDAFGKLPAGVLDGNLRWLGDYEECRMIRAEVPAGPNLAPTYFQGRYCEASFGLPVSQVEAADAVCSGRNITAGCTRDTGDTLFAQLGICAPASCSSNDLTFIIQNLLPTRDLCDSFVSCESERPITIGAVCALIYCGVVALLLVGATAYDLLVHGRSVDRRQSSSASAPIGQSASLDSGIDNNGAAPQKLSDPIAFADSIVSFRSSRQLSEPAVPWHSQVLLSFSLYSNGRALFSYDVPRTHLPFLNGIRFLSIVWLVYTNVYLYAPFYIINLKDVPRMPGYFLFQVINNAGLATDTLFVLGGFLVGYHWFGRVARSAGDAVRSPLFWLRYFGRRFVRLLPAYASVLLVGATLWPLSGNGPFWQGADSGLIKDCPHTWWRNLLFINNFFATDTSCMPWGWYVSSDMQYYVLASAILAVLWLLPAVGLGVCGFLLLVSVVARGVVALTSGAPPSYMVTTDPDSFHMLTVPAPLFQASYMRFASYVVGVLASYALFRMKAGINVGKTVATLSLIGVCATLFGLVFGLYDYAQGEPISTTLSAFYAATHRTVWAAAIAALLAILHSGYGGVVNKILSWNIWLPLSKLTFGIYLVNQFVVVHFYSTLKRPVFATHYEILYYFIGTFVFSVALSIVINLSFEAPWRRLEVGLFSSAAEKSSRQATAAL